MRKLTTEWLIEKKGCVDGMRWFKRNYPDGMTLTKRNTNEFVGKLSRRKRNCEEHTLGDLYWLIKAMGKSGDRLLIVDFDKTPTQKEIAEAFWKDYKGISNE